jgi:DNA (cytosine-5)-methyltransferase 1
MVPTPVDRAASLGRSSDGVVVPSRQLFGLSLCSGAGGLELALHIADPAYRTVCFVEREAFAAAALVARMDDASLDRAPIWNDVASFDGRPWRGLVDILTAGYPCQPFSTAGKQRGTRDPRHLWPHIRRIIGEVRPRWLFLENVANHLRIGFREVAGDLRAMGYGGTAGIYTAFEVGAGHQRKRLYLLAHADRGDADCASRQHSQNRRLRLVRQHEAAHAVYADDGGRVMDAARLAAHTSSFAPGPNETARWSAFRRKRQAAQPAISRSAYGLALGLDRSRLAGNGVHPLAAAYALRSLLAAQGYPAGVTLSDIGGGEI